MDQSQPNQSIVGSIVGSNITPIIDPIIDPTIARLPPRVSEDEPYIYQGEADIFEGRYAKLLQSQVSDSDKERYRKIGESMYNNINFETNQPVETMPSEMIESLGQIREQIKSGLHPSFLDDNEKMLLKDAYGKDWYKIWGYCEKDLDSIFTLTPHTD